MAKSYKDEIVVDKNFWVPPFVIDMRQENADDAMDDYVPGDVPGDGSPPAPELPGTGGGRPRLPPTSYTIVSQTVRITADGRSVVDVVFEFPDAPGISHIDVRSTKV